MKPATNNVALATAENALKQKGRSFYWARRLLGPVHASRATRLYGFCRHLDDLADEATSVASARIKLSAASQDIAVGVSSDLVIQDGIELMQECRISPVIAVKGVHNSLLRLRPGSQAGQQVSPRNQAPG